MNFVSIVSIDVYIFFIFSWNQNIFDVSVTFMMTSKVNQGEIFFLKKTALFSICFDYLHKFIFHLLSAYDVSVFFPLSVFS